VPASIQTFEMITFSEVEEAVEDVFGKGSVGLDKRGASNANEIARATFVRASALLVVKQRCEAIGLNRSDGAQKYFEINRKVRQECSAFLGIEENEAFRLHHRAAGLRAKDPKYRDVAQRIERDVAKRYGMVV